MPLVSVLPASKRVELVVRSIYLRRVSRLFFLQASLRKIGKFLILRVFPFVWVGGVDAVRLILCQVSWIASFGFLFFVPAWSLYHVDLHFSGYALR